VCCGPGAAGIASALLRQCFAVLRQRGQRRAGLGVDAGSLTNAVRLYENCWHAQESSTNL